MGDWLFLLSPWFALVGLILWDTRDKKGPWQSKFKDPMTLVTGILAVGTVALAIVAVLQWKTLEQD